MTPRRSLNTASTHQKQPPARTTTFSCGVSVKAVSILGSGKSLMGILQESISYSTSVRHSAESGTYCKLHHRRFLHLRSEMQKPAMMQLTILPHNPPPAVNPYGIVL